MSLNRARQLIERIDLTAAAKAILGDDGVRVAAVSQILQRLVDEYPTPDKLDRIATEMGYDSAWQMIAAGLPDLTDEVVALMAIGATEGELREWMRKRVRDGLAEHCRPGDKVQVRRGEFAGQAGVVKRSFCDAGYVHAEVGGRVVMLLNDDFEVVG